MSETTIYDLLSSNFLSLHTNGLYDDLDTFVQACGTSVPEMLNLNDAESASVNRKVQTYTDFASLTEMINAASTIHVRNNPPDEDELAKFL